MNYMYNVYACILHVQNGFFFFFCSLNFVLYLCVARGHLNRPIRRAGGSAGNFRSFAYIYIKTRCGFCRSRLYGQQGYHELAIDSIEFASSETVSTAQYDILV